MKRMVVIALACLAVIAAGTLFFLYRGLDGLVKAEIEKVGSEAAGTRVRVARVRISLADAKGRIEGLTIANPPGYKSRYAFRLNSVSLRLDPASLTGNPVVVREILIDAPEVTAELGPAGSNIVALQRNVQAYAGEQASRSAAAQPGGTGEPSGLRFIISRLDVTSGKVSVRAGAAPAADYAGKLGDIRLTDVGKETGGATPAQIASKVLAVLVTDALNSAQTLSFKGAANALGGKTQHSMPAGIGEALRSILGR